MKIFTSLILSVVFGLLVWFVAHSLLLPVTDAIDSEGHGPDVGSAEWHNSIRHTTEHRQRKVLYLGVGAGTVALIVLVTRAMLMKKEA